MGPFYFDRHHGNARKKFGAGYDGRCCVQPRLNQICDAVAKASRIAFCTVAGLVQSPMQ